MIKRIKEIGFVDVDTLWELKHIGINLMKYKNISEPEAVEFLRRDYVTYQNFIDIMNYTIDNWVKK